MRTKINMRDVLLAVYGAGWAAAVGVSLVKTGEVSATLWGALGLGVGTIIGAFRVERPSVESGAGGNAGAGNRPTADSEPRPEDAR